MNPMFDFTAKEISMIHMGLFAIASTTRDVMENDGAEPPAGFIETLHSVIDKLNEVIELRAENDNQFSSIVESQLTDVDVKSSEVISNPDLPINEYN